MTIGFAMVVMGMLSMIAATFIIFKDPSKKFTPLIFCCLLEPAAWFLLWGGHGFDHLPFKKAECGIDFIRRCHMRRGIFVLRIVSPAQWKAHMDREAFLEKYLEAKLNPALRSAKAGLWQ